MGLFDNVDFGQTITDALQGAGDQAIDQVGTVISSNLGNQLTKLTPQNVANPSGAPVIQSTAQKISAVAQTTTGKVAISGSLLAAIGVAAYFLIGRRK